MRRPAGEADGGGRQRRLTGRPAGEADGEADRRCCSPSSQGSTRPHAILACLVGNTVHQRPWGCRPGGLKTEVESPPTWGRGARH